MEHLSLNIHTACTVGAGGQRKRNSAFKISSKEECAAKAKISFKLQSNQQPKREKMELKKEERGKKQPPS